MVKLNNKNQKQFLLDRMETIHESWKPFFDQYDINLDEIYGTITVYPPREHVFRIFSMPVEEIRVVLLGQDPYHGSGQAHGLSFSVPDGVTIPPSLRNIFKELVAEFPERKYEFKSGNLEAWFEREKIFLFNAALTVLPGMAGSHMTMWEGFTNDVIRWISEKNPNCVFLLLGNFAKGKAEYITNKNRIVTAVHPSPLAQGFLGSGVFKKVEAVLGQPIDWRLISD
jgi:uracil-DNA glycosylase